MSLYIYHLKYLLTTLVFVFCCPALISAGSYGDSAHGNSAAGVSRTATSNEGYARGNCGHCHEQHSSLAGSEPSPGNGAAPFTLFNQNFDTSAITSPYQESANFCFFCHNTLTSSGQQVNNFDYSQNFGCATLGEVDIRSTMNQASNHNLYDVYNWARTEFSWFTDSSNPCNACHNPHLAKDNAGNAQDPAFSAISKPSDHSTLWGVGITETMGNTYGVSYEPLFCDDSHANREPAASNNAVQGRENTPDYIGFCTDCHTSTANIYSTNLGRYLKKIDWNVGGDKHGAQLTDGHDFIPAGHIITPRIGGGGLVQPPYTIGNDYVVSCLDCHEPHGSDNIMLLRRRVNGGDLDISITAPGVVIGANDPNIDDIGYLCLRCHYDDKAQGAFNQTVDNHWRFVHHADSVGWDTPYGGLNGNCSCHSWSGNGMGRPLCGDCHFHGSVITIDIGGQAGQPDSTRKTF